MKRNLAGLVLLVSLLVASGAWALESVLDTELLPPDEAFKLASPVFRDGTIHLEWDIADGYYMYRDKFKFHSGTAGITLGQPQLPPGKVKEDLFFGKVTVYRRNVTVKVPVDGKPVGGEEFSLVVTSQGCNEPVGVCYPPQTKTVSISYPAPLTPALLTKPGNPLAALSQLGNTLGLGSAQDEFLPPDQAFIFSATAVDSKTIQAHWDIAEGYYLYRDKFKFSLKDAPEGVIIGGINLPQGKVKDDPFFGRIQVFYRDVDVVVPISGAAPGQAIRLLVGYQGCADAGLCYPPQTKTVSLELPAKTTKTASKPESKISAPVADEPETITEQDQLVGQLKGGSLLATIGLFFIAGLALAFTPCVFPMIPILSGVIAGHGDNITTRKAFMLSLAYVLAMALTYTAMGVAAGLAGAGIAAWFQDPWVLSAFAGIFVLLSLSMFGFYELQMPSAIQSKLTAISNTQEGGHLLGAGIMGFLSALIVSPCVTAPLIAALIYIGKTGDAVLGGVSLFSLSIGMGVPLLIIGTGGGKLLPKAGAWMDAIKAFFGVLLLGLAVWLISPVLPGPIILALWALLLIVSAIYMGALEQLPSPVSGWRKLWKGLGLALLVYGALLVIGAASGSKDPLAPLESLGRIVGTGSQTAVVSDHALPFKPIKSIEDLDREVAAASKQGRYVMLDFYADWCVACKEFEKFTFSDPGVQQALKNVILLQADVTANDATDRALMKHFGLFGPPSILFFGPDGRERSARRVVGYMNAEQFKAHLATTLR